MFTFVFWKAVLERAIKTFCQVEAGFLGVAGLGILDVDWTQNLSVAGLATIVSVLTSIGTAGLTDGSPSVGNVEELRA